jgi:hypothetical protein
MTDRLASAVFPEAFPTLLEQRKDNPSAIENALHIVDTILSKRFHNLQVLVEKKRDFEEALTF